MKRDSDSGCAVVQLICLDGYWTLSKGVKIADRETKDLEFEIRQDGKIFVARIAPYRIWEVARPIFIVKFEVGARHYASGPSHRVEATTLCSNVGLCAHVTVHRMSWDAAERWPKP